MKVSWDHEIPNIYGKIKHVPNHQPDHSYIPKNCLSLARMGQALGLHEQVTSTARNFSVHSNRSRNQSSGQMGVSIVMGVPQNCRFIMEKSYQHGWSRGTMGYPHFRKPPNGTVPAYTSMYRSCSSGQILRSVSDSDSTFLKILHGANHVGRKHHIFQHTQLYHL
jgi:hypothetical protein